MCFWPSAEIKSLQSNLTLEEIQGKEMKLQKEVHFYDTCIHDSH